MSKVADKNARRITYALSYVFLIGVGISMAAPLLWMLSTSFKSPDADVMNLKDILPDGLHWENYRTVMVETNFARALFNSALVTITITVGQVFTSSLAAFAFARLQFKGRDKLFLGYLGTMMIPGAVTMIPVFILLRHLHWVNTYWGLIVPAMFSAYGTFMLRQFFMTIPRELEDAAIMDGCGTLGVYWHVVLPLSKPALATLSILTFMGSWRNFMWPVIITHTRDMFTLPVALAQFQEMYGVQWVLMMAGSVIMIIPMLAVFIFGQRYFVEGIQLGALKG
ncbi:MAG: carbohydrate ABC transporter permease [Lentisphaeria bacterium]|nr:carbohydrate ABC transporter permease [Lentisphaeria bacterium]